MSKGRLEAFSDGVIAIIITIMVLELKGPHGSDWAALHSLLPALLTYILSFVYLGIYWNNHHHLLHAVKRVNGKILWANLHLMFWLSLIPFGTGWMRENEFASLPTAIYGLILLCAAIAYTILLRIILKLEGPQSTLAKAVGSDRKGNISLICYVAAIPLAFYYRWAAVILYAVVALIWLVPDKRIETLFAE